MIAGSGFGAVQGTGQVWLGTSAGVVQSWSDGVIVAQVGAGAATGNAQVLQNNVMSNAVSFTVNTPQIASIDPNSGVAGAQVTFAGTGFGANPGVAWLGSMAGQVVSWTDAQVVATVAAGAVSGVAKIQRSDGLWSNALGFTVPAPGSNTVMPSLLNMVVGDTRTLQALSAGGQTVMGLTWTSSNPAVVSLSTDDPPVLTAVAAGHVTITAGTGSADVTVWAGALPVGTTIWSNPGNGSGVSWIVPAVPSATGVADVFAIQNDGTVQAITSDGTVAWTADVSQAYVGSWFKNFIPDFQGGLVIQGNGGNRNPWIEKLDGVTGAPYPKCYLGPSAAILQTEGGTSPYVAAHPDGTVFAVVESTVWPGPVSVVGIDPTTGTQKFSVPLPQDACAAHYFCGLIIAGDGYAYVVYEAIAADPGAYYIDASVMLLRIGTDGSYDRIHVYDWVYAGDDYAWNTPYDAGMITNADTGILLTWMMSDGSVWMAVTAGTSASLVGAPGGMQVTPVLQAQDGSFFGTAYADIMAFDASGNVRWLVPNDSPAIATADGGVIGTSGITYDANGNATGWRSPVLQSWRGIEYSGQGSVQAVEGSLILEDGASFWPTVGGNPSGNGTAFVQCPCLLQSLADSGSSGNIRKLEAAGTEPPPPPPPPGPPSYVLLVGDPGLNTVDCPTDIRHCHNMGQIFMATAQTMANQLSNQGNLAYPPIRVSTVQDFNAGLTQNGSITGGVIYVGHGGVIPIAPGQELSALAPGEQRGTDTNISALNVQSLKNTQLGSHAVMKLWACNAGRGGRDSIAQLIANQLQMVVYAPVMGVYFSNDPNVKAPDGTKLPVPNVSLPVYPIQQFGNQLTPFCPGMLCR
jgi:hypothetical protein